MANVNSEFLKDAFSNPGRINFSNEISETIVLRNSPNISREIDAGYVLVARQVLAKKLQIFSSSDFNVSNASLKAGKEVAIANNPNILIVPDAGNFSSQTDLMMFEISVGSVFAIDFIEEITSSLNDEAALILCSLVCSSSASSIKEEISFTDVGMETFNREETSSLSDTMEVTAEFHLINVNRSLTATDFIGCFAMKPRIFFEYFSASIEIKFSKDSNTNLLNLPSNGYLI